MYCKKCGNFVDKNDIFCGYCGKKLVEESSGDNDVSLIFGIVSIVSVFVPFVSVPLAIASIVLGKRGKGKGGGSNGIAVAIISLIISILYLILLIGNTLGSFNYFDNLDFQDNYNFEEEIDDFEITGNSFNLSDGSNVFFDTDMNYSWYIDKNNYSLGTYEVYNGIEAIRYISSKLSDYGISEDEQFNMFRSSMEIDNYYLLIFNCREKNVDGVSSSCSALVPYFGLYDEDGDYMEMVNMVDGSKVIFSLIDGNGGFADDFV